MDSSGAARTDLAQRVLRLQTQGPPAAQTMAESMEWPLGRLADLIGDEPRTHAC